MTDFAEFFERATGHRPYKYQKRLAGDNSIPDVIDLPTGSGKTEAAVVAVWLWGRVSGHRETPRRLVYCLPRRSLVEQTVGRVRAWVKSLGLGDRMGVSQIMGGDSQWGAEAEPEREYILVGTQDMLLSGALNRQSGRGFGVWPIHFALLNNDCLWVMDEVQVMENGLPTSRQLDAFRRQMGTFGQCRTIWMSATINEKWLKTPDSEKPRNIFRLTPDEAREGELGRRNGARKMVRKADIVPGMRYGKNDVGRLLEFHHAGTPTAIIVNTVRRAQDIYAEVKKTDMQCILVHSRFRAAERRAVNERMASIRDTDDTVIISTQVLEAGVDISVRTLVTELAPWASMVQRFGRCNRGAEYDTADIVWVDNGRNTTAPYAAGELGRSRAMLECMEGGSAPPAGLPKEDAGIPFDSVLRRRDMVELFGTHQDLSGGRTDASRFVRTAERPLDVDVFWRSEDKESAPDAGEVCSIPLSAAREFIKNRGGSVFDYAAGRWVQAGDICPGQTVMLDCAAGGYTPETGWSPDITAEVDTITAPDKRSKKRADRRAVTLGAHTRHVVTEAARLTGKLGTLGDEPAGAVVEAARHHDVGKAHPVFQKTMTDGGCPDDGRVWAKSPGSARHARPGFRHEAASALAYLARHPGGHLAAYLIAAHHGHVRLSMRSIHPDDKHMLGLDESDVLPAYDDGVVSMQETVLDTSLAYLGRWNGPSWADMATRLLKRHGPFRLAYLEMLVRAADWAASRGEDEGVYGQPECGDPAGGAE